MSRLDRIDAEGENLGTPPVASAAGREAVLRTASAFAPQRANVYVDGFNLYYRALKGSRCKWLDLQALVELVVPRVRLHRLRYFTARVDVRGGDSGPSLRQELYLRALRTLPSTSVHFGQFRTHAVRLALVSPGRGEARTAEVWRTSEKGSDVNLATAMLVDAYRRDFDVALVLSNDSDLEAPVRAVRDDFNLPVGVLDPTPRASIALREAATFYRRVRLGAICASQFPDVLTDGDGTFRKPDGW